MKYDIAIVGGGPAGSTAGINLIGSGQRVLLLDRTRFPRLKPCGGGISYRVYRRFPYLAEVLHSVPTNFIHRVVVESPSKDILEVPSSEPLYAMIRRYEFDAALLNACKRGGVEVREDVTISRTTLTADGVVLTSTAGEEFSADLVIGADGVNSAVAVHGGFRGAWDPLRVAIDGTEETPLSDLSARQDTMYLYFSGGHGYAYVFPKAEHINFGAGYQLDYYRQHGSGKPHEDHERLLDHLKETGVVRGRSRRENFHAYLLPIGGPLPVISKDRMLLAGDAAGFVNSFTAEGIYYAMVSGEHAARVAKETIRKRDYSTASLRQYDAMCNAEMGSELRRSLMIQRQLFSNPRRIDSVVRICARSTPLRDLFTNYAVGNLSYEEMKRRALVQALPAFLWYKATKLAHTLRASN